MMKTMTLAAMATALSAGMAFAQQPAPAAAEAAKPQAVKTEYGFVQGAFDGNLTVYKGIPFAAPPVGDLRWRPPQPPTNWSGVKETTQFAPGPIQSGRPPSGTSEDCLYLNIWSPAKGPDDRIPVLVWIYGGGFAGGATSEPNYSGEKLARKGVVLVSIAYRVGQMGFFVHPQLTAESPNHSSGNYGLLDMVAGLQWIQKNIAAFGGDPKKVTIFGESAGGIAVSMLSASPLAKGLFHGAVSQSGGSFGPPRPSQTMPGENLKRLADAEHDGVIFTMNAGVTSVAELRAMSPDKLPSSRGLGMSWPVIDGYVIPDDQHKLYESGHFNKTPILVGYNSDEGASFSPPKTPEDYVSGVRKRYGKFTPSLLNAYPTASDRVPKTARDLARDAAFGWHTWSWACLNTAIGRQKSFVYYFDQHPDYSADPARADAGSPHGQDVAYVFQHVNRNSNKTDLDISDAMSTYWVNFAKYGDPNGDGLPKWPAFNEEDPNPVMYFHDTPHPGPIPSLQSLRTLDVYFAWRRTPEGEAFVKPAPQP